MGDPTEAAFLVAASKLQLSDERDHKFTRVKKMAFTTERQMMSVEVIDHRLQDARFLTSEGAPAALLPRCAHLRVGMRAEPLTENKRAHLTAQTDEMADAALRTFAGPIARWIWLMTATKLPRPTLNRR